MPRRPSLQSSNHDPMNPPTRATPVASRSRALGFRFSGFGSFAILHFGPQFWFAILILTSGFARFGICDMRLGICGMRFVVRTGSMSDVAYGISHVPYPAYIIGVFGCSRRMGGQARAQADKCSRRQLPLPITRRECRRL